MIKRFNRLLIELPKSKFADPNAAADVQKLLGGKFGEISTGAPIQELNEVPEEFVPGILKEDFDEIAKRLMRSAGI